MNAFDIKPEWLVYLKAVAEARSIRLAAEQLYLTEQTLRYNLKALEDLLQTELLISGEQGLELTSQGHALLENGQSFLQRLTQTQARIKTLLQTRPEFRLAISFSYPSENLAGLLNEMYRQFPGLQLNVHLDSPREIEKQLFLGMHHIGLITWDPAHSRLTAIKGPVSPGVYVRRSQGPVAEVYLLPKIWRYSKQQEVITYPDEVAAYPVRYLGRIGMIRALVELGAGIGYLPQAHVQPLLDRGELLITSGPPLEFSLYPHILMRDREHLSEPARYFVDRLQAEWGEKVE